MNINVLVIFSKNRLFGDNIDYFDLVKTKSRKNRKSNYKKVHYLGSFYASQTLEILD